ncbi:MAG: formimidoylglutamate deiminase [Longimicrobiales bacterium]
MPTLIPELVYERGRFVTGRAVGCDPERGVITAVDSSEALESGDAGVVPLPGRALIAGFVNAHSHAFQRLIRGRTQWRTARADSDFWGWRDAMYAVALALTPDEIEITARHCFLEMLHAGYTSVGEFHYLHRDAQGAAYADPNELAQRVIAAARAVGIRIVLLNACYARGGMGAPLGPEQRRFATPELDPFLAATEGLAQRYRADGFVEVGVAPHSVRAVPREWLAQLAAWARRRDAPCHMHVSEQPAEVEAAVRAWGVRPVELLAEEGVLSSSFTAVHATHVLEREIALLAGAGANVCACPTTERDLADGFLPGLELLESGVPICIGSDSQTRLDPFEELRLLEYHERLRRLRRNVLLQRTQDQEERLYVAPALLAAGARSGARSLRLEAGEVEAGMLADLIALDLSHPALAGWTTESLPSLLALCVGPEVVSDVWVGGVARVSDRQHALDGITTIELQRVSKRVSREA